MCEFQSMAGRESEMKETRSIQWKGGGKKAG